MRTVETKTLTAVVKNGVVHVSKPDDKRIFAKVRITTHSQIFEEDCGNP
jgi:hypothetical protein